MTLLVGLVRHGAHDELGRVLSGRASDVGLSRSGREQAKALALGLLDTNISRLESSPRKRTRQTAEVLGAALSLPVQIVPALDEIDFGGWAGQSFASLDADPAWHCWNAERETAPTPGGETMAGAVRRAMHHIDGIAACTGTVLCVTHCDIIRGVVAHCLGLSLDNILRFDINPASISWLKPDGQGGAQVLTLNGRN